MAWRICGYAAILCEPDNQIHQIFAPGCFVDFLNDPKHLNIPMLNAHDASQVMGRWVYMEEDGIGLFVVGELDEGPLSNPLPGLSTGPGQAKGPPCTNAYGGTIAHRVNPDEISLVTDPHQPRARVKWQWQE